jgi:P4 family phage/plasmid primase-like protien
MSTSRANHPIIPKLPQALIARVQWVLWRYETRKGKPTKVPYQVNGGRAKCNDPATWSAFDAVIAAWTKNPKRYDGIGFVFAASDSFVGIDLDNCIDQAGNIKPWAQLIIEQFANTYMEISPSGRGLKIWAKARLDGPGRRTPYQDGAIEVYDRGRFFTTTGNAVHGAPLQVEDHQAEVAALYALTSSSGQARKGKADLNRQEPLTEGERHPYLLSAAAQYRARGRDRDEINAELAAINQRLCKPPKADHELQEIANWAGRLPVTAKHQSGTATAGEETTISAKDLADAITAADRFAKNAGGRLYVFGDGVYKPTGESFIRHRVKTLLNDWGMGNKWTTRKSNEVTEYIRVDAKELWEAPPRDVINVKNGLLKVHTLELVPHSSEFLSPIQLPIAFDPLALCPAWEQFISEVFPEDSDAIAWEILAWLMTPDTSIQKAVLLTGEGGNGKSTYLRGCVAFIGKHNTTAINLHKLEQDRFAAARLSGKLANICSDLPTAHLSSTSMFKALTGGDVVNAEYKYADSFEFVPFAKLVFSANQLPRSDDATHGFFRRWLVVPFTRTFEDGAPGTVPREQLDAILSPPGELSGVLNKALLALSRIRKAGFSQSESLRREWEEFRTATDPLSVWLDHNTVDEVAVVVPKADLRKAYNLACEKAGRASLTKTAFGLALRRVRPTVRDAQRTVRGRVTDCYTGIGFRMADPDGGEA